MSNFWQNIASFGSGSLFTALIIYLIFTNPDTVKKWLALFYDFLSIFYKNFKYKATKFSIESKINGFVENLSTDSDVEPTKVKIKWTARDEDERCLIEENEVILVMRDKEHKNRNFVHAAYFFTSNMLLWRTKRHISKKQSQAIDIYTTKKILENEDRSSLRIFMESYFQPLLEDSKIKELIKKFIEIDKSGFYTSILITELTYLGQKTLLDSRDNDVILEVKGLIEFLYNFATREQGDDSTQDVFIGKYSRCSIKIVSTHFLREQEKISSPVKRIKDTLAKGVENLYTIGPYGDGGKEFIDKVCESVIKSNDKYTNVSQKKILSSIIVSGRRKPKDSYFVHLQNPSAINYIINQEMVQEFEGLEN